jgi:hypothetical protein
MHRSKTGPRPYSAVGDQYHITNDNRMEEVLTLVPAFTGSLQVIQIVGDNLFIINSQLTFFSLIKVFRRL